MTTAITNSPIAITKPITNHQPQSPITNHQSPITPNHAPCAQLELFFTALGFFTRIPVPGWVPWSPERLNHAARYFPLVGWTVGAAGALVLWATALVLPASIAVVLSMAATIRLTGAFHEDGWADACDGLGGGWGGCRC